MAEHRVMSEVLLYITHYRSRRYDESQANGPKTTLRRNPINEQGFGRCLAASFWSSKSRFGLDFLDLEMTSRPWRWKMSICYGKAYLDNPWNRGHPIDYLDPECVK